VTCIVGIATSDGVIIGADSMASDGRLGLTRSDPKVFRLGRYVIGYTSSYRMGQLIRHSGAAIPTPKNPDRRWRADDERGVEEMDRFIATEFIPALRGVFEKGGWLGKAQMGRDDGGDFLVGYGSHLYAIHDDLQYARHACGYTAVGSGRAVALGALHATAGRPPEERATAALMAAAEFTPDVRGPFLISETQ
jgi:hypothetical protein